MNVYKNTITSVDNIIIKQLVLLQSAKRRREFGSFLAEGVRCIRTLLDSGTSVEHIFITEQSASLVEQLTPLDQSQVTIVSERVMRKISQASTPSGMLARFRMPGKKEFVPKIKSLVLSQLQDPGNMGTLIRTAVALDITSIVILSGSTDPWSYKTVQASAGTVGYADIYEMDWKEFLECKNALAGSLTLGLVVSNGLSPRAIQLLDQHTSIFLLVGSEAHGLSQEQIRSCDTLVTLPMPSNKTESLNAAIAGSIALYQLFGDV